MKIFLILFLFFCNFFVTLAYQSPKIISREEWWANDDFLDKNYIKWREKLEKQRINQEKQTEAQKKAAEKSREKTKKINNFLLTNFSWENELTDKIYFYNDRELVWPIEYSEKIRAIVVHHTHSSFSDPFEWIKNIYKYHSFTNGRWDIWYNFLIWENWEIFEWRAWWETAVWAHTVRNNRQTIGISLIWNYDEKPISEAQYKSLESLIKYLVEKYNINLDEKQPFFRACNKSDCIDPLEVNYFYPIIWHRDAWHTTCPGQKLYEQLEKIRDEIKSQNPKEILKNKILIEKYFKIFDSLWEQKLLQSALKIEKFLEKYKDKRVLELKKYLIKYFEEKQNFEINENANKKIKIKLSYPENRDYLDISDWENIFNLKIENNKLFVNWVEKQDFVVQNFKNPYVEIISWDRTPNWHKEGIYKDNKFRWEIFVYLKDWKFVVVNILPLEDYLKWLWEISNTENRQKAEAILISARTYALWYIEKDRKFPGEFYDWSDDPDIFQKYLGYDLEQRSPNLNKILDETRGIVLKYNWDLIKPWYFSSSSGKTLSFYDYCIKNKNSENFCEKQKEKYPFLQSKVDPGWIWKQQSWHWVWLSWTWATYFSSKWWTSSMILKYFYEAVEL